MCMFYAVRQIPQSRVFLNAFPRFYHKTVLIITTKPLLKLPFLILLLYEGQKKSVNCFCKGCPE